MTKAELEMRVAELETELAWRRNHICSPVPSCNCMSGVTSAVPCPAHPPWPHSRIFTTTLRPGQNICGGAAYNGGQTQVINNAGANPVARFELLGPAADAYAAGCAGGWAGQTYTVVIPAGR